jgi:hypothetical protein
VILHHVQNRRGLLFALISFTISLSLFVGCRRSTQLTVTDFRKSFLPEFVSLTTSNVTDFHSYVITRNVWRRDFLAQFIATEAVLREIRERTIGTKVMLVPQEQVSHSIDTLLKASFGPMGFPFTREEIGRLSWFKMPPLKGASVYYFRINPPANSFREAVFLINAETNSVWVFGIRSSG